MSFANSNRSFGQKSVKKKKQEFHRHKIKPGQSDVEENIDFASLKERTMVSLTHLGQQRFSQGPSGYSLGNWMKSFNLLLDDFEESKGSVNLPKEYFDKRFELTSALTISADSLVSSLDSDIQRKREEYEKLSTLINDTEIRQRQQHQVEDLTEKIRVNEDERSRLGEELERRKAAVSHRKKQIEDSSKLFRRIFGNSSKQYSTTLAELESRVNDTQVKLNLLSDKIAEQENKIAIMKRIEGVSMGLRNEVPDLEKQLESVSLALEDLEARKSNQLELLEERIRITEQMKEAISKVEL